MKQNNEKTEVALADVEKLSASDLNSIKLDEKSAPVIPKEK